MLPSKLLICFFLFLIINLINTGCVASQATISLSVDIEPDYSIVSAGNDVIMQINLIQLGGQKGRDVIVFLSIADAEGNVIAQSTETTALRTRSSLVSRLNIPKDANEGAYTVNVKIFDINEEDLLAETSRQIIIETTKITRADVYLIGFCLAIIALFVLIIILYRRIKHLHSKEKITKSDVKKYLEERER